MPILAAGTRFACVQVTSTRFLPLLVSPFDQLGPEHLVDGFTGELSVAWSFGPPYGERLVTGADLDALGLSREALRRTALENLNRAVTGLRMRGQPPALMLSFDGIECAALLADAFWARFQRTVPGELVVGVPARDVVIVTGSLSRPGLDRVRRAVDRVFSVGDQHLLSRDLLVWRHGGWQPFTPVRPPSRPRAAEAWGDWPGDRHPISPRPGRYPGTRRPTGPPR